MKRIIILLMTVISVFFLTSCTPTKPVSADYELTSQIKTIIKQSDFLKLLYIGRYYIPTEDISISQNERTYKSFEVTYSDISDDFLEVSNIDFGGLKEYSPNYYRADIPFNDLTDIKKEIETVYTRKCAEELLYSIYDRDYFEYNNTLLHAFDSDTVTAFSADYESVEIKKVSADKLTATIQTYHHLENGKLQVTYNFVLDNELWKIEEIIFDD